MNEEQIKISLKEQIQTAYKEYLSKVERYANALRALGETVNIGSPLPAKLGKPMNTNKHNVTMKEKIISVLTTADKPLTSREIMEAINEAFIREEKYDFNSFSGNFSQTWKKAGVKKYERPSAPIEFRVVYGLSDWFTASGDLKPHFKELLGDLF